ncbi:unnamed protein product [Camellia sinensis]
MVTRLRCGGFIFAFCRNHTMADGTRVFQFLMALAEMARGANAPFVQPVWQRELLNSRNPPRVTCTHHEYDDNVVNAESNIICAEDKVVFRNFFFGFKELHALHMLFPPHQCMCSTFDLLTACIWKYRIASLQLNPSEEVRLSFSSNARMCFKPPLPIGYYGNAVACPTALSTAGEQSLDHALELVRKTKSLVTEEYMRSTIDLVVIKGRPFIKYEQAYFVSDVLKMKFSDADFGWGNVVFGGPSLVGEMKGSYFVYFKNEMGEDGIVVPICLPPVAMERFILEVESIFKGGAWNRGQNRVGGQFWTGIEDAQIWLGSSFGRSFVSGILRDEVWFGSMEMLRCFAWGETWVLKLGLFRVWIRKDVSDHGSGDGSRFCSAVAVGFDRPWVCLVVVSVRSFESEKKCSDHESGAGCLTVLGVYRSW